MWYDGFNTNVPALIKNPEWNYVFNGSQLKHGNIKVDGFILPGMLYFIVGKNHGTWRLTGFFYLDPVQGEVEISNGSDQ